MVNTNPEKIMSRILGTQTTRKARPVRRRMRQDTILPRSGIDEVDKYDVFLRDSKYGDEWSELLEKNNIWHEEWDCSELSVKNREKMSELAEKFIKDYKLTKEYKNYKYVAV